MRGQADQLHSDGVVVHDKVTISNCTARTSPQPYPDPEQVTMSNCIVCSNAEIGEGDTEPLALALTLDLTPHPNPNPNLNLTLTLTRTLWTMRRGRDAEGRAGGRLRLGLG